MDMTWNRIAESLLEATLNKDGVRTLFKTGCEWDRISFCLRDPKISKMVDNWIKSNTAHCEHKKSFPKAEELREEGNKYFGSGDLGRALQKYNLSLLFSVNRVENDLADATEIEIGKIQTALAYGNRSAVFLRQQRLDECERDIEMAVTEGYPVSLAHKLKRRKEQVALARKQAAADGCKTEHEKKYDAKTCCKADLEDKFTNSQLPSAIPTIVCMFNEKQGRYLLSTDKISKGTVIIREQPYGSVLLPQWRESHCHNCYQRLVYFVPCARCAFVKFCSTPCRDEAWRKYHVLECDFLPILHQIGIAHLAIRIVIVTGLSRLLDFRLDHNIGAKTPSGNTVGESSPQRIQKQITERSVNEKASSCTVTDCQTRSSVPGFNADGTFSGYQAVYSLVTHTDDTQVEDLFLYSVMATLLLKILCLAGFFTSLNDDDAEDKIDGSSKMESSKMDDAKLYIGFLLSRHIQQLICNAHAITDLTDDSSSNLDLVHSITQERIATGIYPTTSLMNHSCEPTILSSFNGSYLTIKVVKDVASGEEIFNCYGPHYQRMEREERLKALKQQYHFLCSCRHCQQESDLSRLLRSYKCKNCDEPLLNYSCKSCGSNFSSSQLVERTTKAKSFFHLARDALDQANTGKAVRCMEKCIELAETVLYSKNITLGHYYDFLGRCYAQRGEFRRSVAQLDKSLTIVAFQYGKDSVEFGNELLKYLDLVCSLLLQLAKEGDSSLIQKEGKTWTLKALKIVADCQNIFQTDVKDDSSVLEDLFDKENFLRDFLDSVCDIKCL